jgi:hypothetical protein
MALLIDSIRKIVFNKQELKKLVHFIPNVSFSLQLIILHGAELAQ